jgi:hypothetical protein
MEEITFETIIEKFKMKNDLTVNPNIWMGHAKIGYHNRITIPETKEMLSKYFPEQIPEGTPTPEELKKTLDQWKDAHPFQQAREEDQPMFIKRGGENIEIAVIWPWQMKEGVASLMLYKGVFRN